MEPADQPRTYQDLLRTEREANGGPIPELLGGRIVYKAAPRAAHSRAQHKVSATVDPADGPEGPDRGGWWIFVEPDWRLGPHDILRPDVAGWRRERLPEVPDGALDLAPDWVCEVLSPSHAAYDRITKADIYRRNGVSHLWFVDPEAHLLEVFERAEDNWVFVGVWTDGAAEAIPPFPFEIQVGNLFIPRSDAPPLAQEGLAVAYRAR